MVIPEIFFNFDEIFVLRKIFLRAEDLLLKKFALVSRTLDADSDFAFGYIHVLRNIYKNLKFFNFRYIIDLLVILKISDKYLNTFHSSNIEESQPFSLGHHFCWPNFFCFKKFIWKKKYLHVLSGSQNVHTLWKWAQKLIAFELKFPVFFFNFLISFKNRSYSERVHCSLTIYARYE